MRQYWTTIILILTMPLGELHTYAGEEVQNWIWKAYRPMPLSWNIKFAMDEIIIVMYFLSWVLYKTNKVNRTTVITFLFLSILDCFLYFYNYKLGGFGIVYYWFTGIWLIVYNWKSFLKWRQ